MSETDRIISGWRNMFWVGLNVLGIALYLYFSSSIWARAGEQGELGGPGDPLVWGFTALPVLVICALINCLWLGSIFLKFRRHGWRPAAILLLAVFAWFAAIHYDASRSYNGSDLCNPAPASGTQNCE